MRILQCISSLEGGGAEKQFGYLCEGLTKLGHDVVAVSLRPGANLERVLDSGATYMQVTSASNFDPLIICRLHRIIRIHRPELIQSWIPQMDILVGMVAALSKIPHVLSERTSSAGLRQGWRESLRVAIGRRAAAVVANSAGGKAYWQNRAPAVPTIVIPNSIPFEEIQAALPIAQADSAPDLDGELVVYLGRLIEIKNVSKLAAALIAIAAKRDQTKAVFLGDGPLAESIKSAVSAAGYGDRIRVLPYTSKPYGWLKRASVFVSVSNFEGNPNAVLEAVAAGCPVVVSDIPAHREFLDERSATFVSGHSFECIAAGIIDALDNTVLAQKRAVIAKERISGRSSKDIALRYVQVYEETIQKAQQ